MMYFCVVMYVCMCVCMRVLCVCMKKMNNPLLVMEVMEVSYDVFLCCHVCVYVCVYACFVCMYEKEEQSAACYGSDGGVI